MNRSYQDLLVDEPDGQIYLDLVRPDGTTALKRVRARLASPVLRKGDKWSAAAANLLLELDENDAPHLAIDPAAVGGLCPCTHTKTGKTHALTGSGSDLRFVASADFAEGDGFTLNGRAVTARTLGGQPLWPGFFVKGSVTVCHLSGTVLTFSGGGGLGSADQNTVRQWLKKGESLLGGTLVGGWDPVPVYLGKGSRFDCRSLPGWQKLTAANFVVQPVNSGRKEISVRKWDAVNRQGEVWWTKDVTAWARAGTTLEKRYENGILTAGQSLWMEVTHDYDNPVQSQTFPLEVEAWCLPAVQNL